MLLTKVITLQEVQEFAKTLPVRSEGPTAWWSAWTAWWTHDPDDLQPGPIPLDSLGSSLYQGDLREFLENAVARPERYGPDGLNVFMACHHKNFAMEPGESLKLYTSLGIFQEAVRKAIADDPHFQLLTPGTGHEEQETDH